MIVNVEAEVSWISSHFDPGSIHRYIPYLTQGIRHGMQETVRWWLGRKGSCQKPSLEPLVNLHSYGKSPFFMGKSTIHGNFQ